MKRFMLLSLVCGSVATGLMLFLSVSCVVPSALADTGPVITAIGGTNYPFYWEAQASDTEFLRTRMEEQESKFSLSMDASPEGWWSGLLENQPQIDCARMRTAMLREGGIGGNFVLGFHTILPTANPEPYEGVTLDPATSSFVTGAGWDYGSADTRAIFKARAKELFEKMGPMETFSIDETLLASPGANGGWGINHISTYWTSPTYSAKSLAAFRTYLQGKSYEGWSTAKFPVTTVYVEPSTEAGDGLPAITIDASNSDTLIADNNWSPVSGEGSLLWQYWYDWREDLFASWYAAAADAAYEVWGALPYWQGCTISNPNHWYRRELGTSLDHLGPLTHIDYLVAGYMTGANIDLVKTAAETYGKKWGSMVCLNYYGQINPIPPADIIALFQYQVNAGTSFICVYPGTAFRVDLPTPTEDGLYYLPEQVAAWNDCIAWLEAGRTLKRIVPFAVRASIFGSDGTPGMGGGTLSPARQDIVFGGTAGICIWQNSDENYAYARIVGITDNDTPVTIPPPSGSGDNITAYVINNVTASHGVVVTLAENIPPYPAVHASVSGGNGTVAPEIQYVISGGTASINIAHGADYRIATITDNGISKTVANPYVIFNVTVPHSVVVTLAENIPPDPAVHASVSGGYGTVAPGLQYVISGGTASIGITPDANYCIATITDNGTPAAIANPYVITNVTAPHTVVVTFVPLTVSITSPAANAVIVGSSVTINATTSPATVAKVVFYRDTTAIDTDTSSPYSCIWSNVPSGTYALTAKAYGSGGGVTTSSAVNITVWNTADINASGGSASYSSGVFTVAGKGAGITGTADGFRFVYREISGDCTITAKITAVTGTQYTNGRVGVMVRQDTTGGAKEVSSLFRIYSTDRYYFSRRTTTGGSTSESYTSASSPWWVRVVRTGNTLKAYKSLDGTTWTQVGSNTTVTMTNPVQVGLAVTSGNASNTNTATISNVTITQP